MEESCWFCSEMESRKGVTHYGEWSMGKDFRSNFYIAFLLYNCILKQ